MKQDSTTDVPLHQWTDEEGFVRIIKCVNENMTSHGGFVWPKSGPVNPDHWTRDNTCEGGGLFGWAWGTGIGDGKTASAVGMTWAGFRALPENVLLVDGGPKVKAVPGEDGRPAAEVMIVGGMAEVILWALPGRMAWVKKNAKGSAANSGDRGSAANSGYSGSAANSGDSGSAANSGDSGSAANSGDRGSAANSGYSGSAANSGYSGSAANSGYRGSAANSGDSGSAANSGYRGSAANSGDSGSAANSGYSGSAANSGYRGSAANSGDSGSAANSGARGGAFSTGTGGSAANTGEGGFAFSDFRAKSSASGALGIRWYDIAEKRYRFCFGIVGEDGIEADVWYVVRDGRLARQYPAKHGKGGA